MKKQYRSAAQRLNEFVADEAETPYAELRSELEAAGVDVEGFLHRLGRESGLAAPQTKRPTTSERLRALASRARSGAKKVFDDLAATELPGVPSGAYGRSSDRAKSRSGKSEKRGSDKGQRG